MFWICTPFSPTLPTHYFWPFHSLMPCFSHVGLLETPWTVAHQAPLSMGFFRPEYWSGLPCLPRSSRPRDRTHVSCTVGRCFFTAKPLLFSRSVLSDTLQPHGLEQPGFPVLHYLQEFAQTHVYWVSDSIQASHPLSPSSPPALNRSQHWGLFQWVGSASDGQSHWGSPFTQSHLYLNSIHQRHGALIYIYFNFVEKGNQPRQSCEDIQLLLALSITCHFNLTFRVSTSCKAL